MQQAVILEKSDFEVDTLLNCSLSKNNWNVYNNAHVLNNVNELKVLGCICT